MRATCGKCGAKRIDSQLGLEPTPEEYVANLVPVFREVKRVMRKDATAWLNLGDSFSGKQLAGIPWKVAFALQADGWWLRSDIIWAKPNPMPESVTDRPTRAHEYLFLLTKSARYFYDADAIREEGQEWLGRAGSFARNGDVSEHVLPGQAAAEHRPDREDRVPAGRNRRSVWEITTQPYPDAHFATFPPKLVEPCILAGTSPKACGECGSPWGRVTERESASRKVGPKTAARQAEASERGLGDGLRTGFSGYEDGSTGPTIHMLGWRATCRHDCWLCGGDGNGSESACEECEGSGVQPGNDLARSVVLDPFAGSGTTGVVALRHDRSFIGIELSEDYCELARNRIRDDQPLFNYQTEVAA